MRPIAHPIHQAQRPVIECIFRKVIFHQHEPPAYTAGFSQERQWICHMMDYVHE